MRTPASSAALDTLVGSLSNCLTPESARRLIALKADRKLQSRLDDLSRRAKDGKLDPDELAEYENYVSFSTFVAILKSKARQRLAETQGQK
jgi:hypothetical protein